MLVKYFIGFGVLAPCVGVFGGVSGGVVFGENGIRGVCKTQIRNTFITLIRTCTFPPRAITFSLLKEIKVCMHAFVTNTTRARACALN